MTHSLSIISEALHSSVDLIAAFMTLFAVMRADIPPDSGHLYGHGKLENLSSLVETFLLFLTAIIVVYEAIERLFVASVQVDISVYAILVIVISIVVNYSRSKVMYSAAKKYRSQALEADAVHFSADLITSFIVLAGIIPVALGYTITDPIAAIGVSAVIIAIGVRIGKKSIDSLMDAAPAGLEKVIHDEVQKVEGIERVGRIRVRQSGSRTFIDINVFIDKVLPLEIAHGLTEALTKRIQMAIPESDVVVHAEPLSIQSANLVDKIRQESSHFPAIKNIHNVRIFDVDKKLYVDLHLELEGSLSLVEAHDLSNELETRIKALDKSISMVSTHVEPIDEGVVNGSMEQSVDKKIRDTIESIIMHYPDIKCFKNLEIRKVNEKLNVHFVCLFKRNLTVNEAHKIADQLEDAIRAQVRGIDNVSIHLEPGD